MIHVTGAELGLVRKANDGQLGKAKTATDKCAAIVAKEKHSKLAKQNAVNASLRSYFPCLCLISHLISSATYSLTLY